jgi:Fic family protein
MSGSHSGFRTRFSVQEVQRKLDLRHELQLNPMFSCTFSFVDSHDFVDSIFGAPGWSAGPQPYCVYLTKPIPRSLALAEATINELSRADRAIGRLAGSGRLLKNPLLLANTYIRREAVSSTRIEGTEATLDDLFEAETGGAVDADVREVINYVTALDHGLELIKTSEITVELVCRLHVLLLDGVRGEDKQPGLVRERPNWIGSSDPATARFVPPLPTELARGLADWEAFVTSDHDMPPLVACALLHYQFETLHPFLDGNGRLGRLLIVLYLVKNDHLPAPLLYLSSYFEHHKQEYYDTLQGVRQHGDIDGWLQFFLRAVAVQANDAVRRSERLVDLGDDFRRRLAGSRSRAHELIDSIVSAPVITTQRVSAQLGVTPTGAAKLLRQLETAGILVPMQRVPGRSNRWSALEVMSVLREETQEVT